MVQSADRLPYAVGTPAPAPARIKGDIRSSTPRRQQAGEQHAGNFSSVDSHLSFAPLFILFAATQSIIYLRMCMYIHIYIHIFHIYIPRCLFAREEIRAELFAKLVACIRPRRPKCSCHREIKEREEEELKPALRDFCHFSSITSRRIIADTYVATCFGRTFARHRIPGCLGQLLSARIFPARFPQPRGETVAGPGARLSADRASRRVVVDYHSAYLSPASLLLSSARPSVSLLTYIREHCLQCESANVPAARCRGELRIRGALASRYR